MDWGVIWPMRQFPSGILTLGTACYCSPILTKKVVIFWTPANLEWHLERGKMAPNHLPICISKLQVHFEFKVHRNVVGRAKNLQKKSQKWLEIG